MADPVVHLTNGIPDSGTGNITTLGQTLLDGANATHGAKADAKANTTDATPITFMSVFKQISFSIQAAATSLASLVTAIGSTAWDLGSGSGGTRTQRVFVDNSQLAPNQTAATTMATGFQLVDVPTDGTLAVRFGGLTETAPATDTASAGNNGRLQRVAQRLTSLIALLPTALGAGGGLKIDGSGTALPISGTVTANAGTNLNTSALALDATIGTTNTQIGGVTETAPGTDTASAGLNGRLQRIAQRITGLIALLPSAIGQTTKAASLSVAVASDQGGLSNRAFAVAFATLTRPANTTAYSAADSISDNATAGSVTALVSGNIGDVNDDPLFINDILVTSTDTGLAGKRIRAYIFNSDPTASTGVGAGDNVAYSQKKAGYVGSLSGTLETGFSDGTVGRLIPSFNDSATAPVPNVGAGGFIAVKPVSGAKTLYVQYQTLDAFTPSASSTTIIGTIRGWQGRAA